MARVEEYQVIVPISVVIASGETESEVIDLTATIIGQIYIPAEFDGTKLTYEIGYIDDDLHTAKNINDEELSIESVATPTVVLTGAYCIASNDLNGVRFIKFKSDVEQTEDCTIYIVPRLR